MLADKEGVTLYEYIDFRSTMASRSARTPLPFNLRVLCPLLSGDCSAQIMSILMHEAHTGDSESSWVLSESSPPLIAREPDSVCGGFADSKGGCLSLLRLACPFTTKCSKMALKLVILSLVFAFTFRPLLFSTGDSNESSLKIREEIMSEMNSDGRKNLEELPRRNVYQKVQDSNQSSNLSE